MNIKKIRNYLKESNISDDRYEELLDNINTEIESDIEAVVDKFCYEFDIDPVDNMYPIFNNEIEEHIDKLSECIAVIIYDQIQGK